MDYESALTAGAADVAGMLGSTDVDGWLCSPECRTRARTAHENLRRMGMPRVNLLFIGADDVVRRVLATTLSLSEPIASWRPGEPLNLTDAGSIRTLIIREVGELSGVEQARLLEWLGRVVGRVQVICTSGRPLLPLVDDGRFINALYYRLNTVCVDLTD